MKIFWYEFRKSDNKPDVYKKNPYLSSTGELPETTIDLFFKYFRRNSDVRRCIVELQENVWSVGYWYEQNEEVVYELPKIDDKFHNFQELKRRVIRDVSICGNAYILKLRNMSEQIVGYTTIDPRTVKIVSDNTGEVRLYIQFLNWKEVQRYKADDVVHCYDEKDPDNEVFWLSLLEGIITEVLADDEAGLSNYHYFKNNTIPSMLLKVNENISDAEMDNVIEQMKANFKWWKNRHKIGILRGIDGIEKLQDSMADMQYTTLRSFTTERVCATYGIPKVILNYTEGVNYTNAEMQYKKFVSNTIFPRERKIETRFNKALEELFIQEKLQDYTFTILKSQESIDIDKVSVYEKMIQCWILTVNQARAELWYDMYEGIEEADQPLITKNYDLLRDVWLSFPTDTQWS